MKTLTTDYIVKGFETFEVKPIRNTFFRSTDLGKDKIQKCTCGLATLYLIENVDPQNLDTWWQSCYRQISITDYFISKGYEEHYLSGFMNGFDGVIPTSEQEQQLVYMAGYSDGQNVWLEANKFWEEKQHANSSN